MLCERCDLRFDRGEIIHLKSVDVKMCRDCVKETGLIFKGKWMYINRKKVCCKCRGHYPMNTKVCSRCKSNSFVVT